MVTTAAARTWEPERRGERAAAAGGQGRRRPVRWTVTDDDRAAGGLVAHPGDFGLEAEEYAGDVDVEQSAPVLLGEVGYGRAAPEDARVVDADINAAEVFDGAADQVPDVPGAGHVRGDRGCRTALLLDQGDRLVERYGGTSLRPTPSVARRAAPAKPAAVPAGSRSRPGRIPYAYGLCGARPVSASSARPVAATASPQVATAGAPYLAMTGPALRPEPGRLA